MSGIDTILFLCLVAVGVTVQTTTGFAMGLITIGGVTALGLADIQSTAAVISLISLVNTGVALRHTWKHIDVKYFRNICLGMIPCLVAGVVLLEYLSRESYMLLRTLLGVVIISAGTLMMLRPSAWPSKSPGPVATAVGCTGGVIAGLYSAGGAPIAYFMYRQPMDVRVIRSTLLSIFALSTSGRTVVVAIAGHLTRDVLVTAALAVPLVIIVTLLTGKIAPSVPDTIVRRLAFVLLIIVGAFLIVT